MFLASKCDLSIPYIFLIFNGLNSKDTFIVGIQPIEILTLRKVYRYIIEVKNISNHILPHLSSRGLVESMVEALSEKKYVITIVVIV